MSLEAESVKISRVKDVSETYMNVWQSIYASHAQAKVFEQMIAKQISVPPRKEQRKAFVNEKTTGCAKLSSLLGYRT